MTFSSVMSAILAVLQSLPKILEYVEDFKLMIKNNKHKRELKKIAEGAAKVQHEEIKLALEGLKQLENNVRRHMP